MAEKRGWRSWRDFERRSRGSSNLIFLIVYNWIIRSWYEGSSEEVVCLCLAGTVLLPALPCSTPPLLLLFSSGLHLLLLCCNVHCALLCFLLCTTSLSPFMACWSSNQQTGLSFSSSNTMFFSLKAFLYLASISFSKFNAILFYWKLFMFCFKLQYNHTRRLASAKKLLSYNNKNILYCILTTVHVLFVWFVASMRKVRWCHQVLSFYVLPFATTQVCPALFQKPQLLFLPSRPFSTRLATALCSRLLQEAGLDPFHISSRPLRISENYKMSDCSEEVWGESAHETLFQTFLEKSRKGVLL